MAQKSQFCLIYNFSNLFPSKQTRMTWNGQFHLIRNFSNFFPLKWLRMTRNSQFHSIHNLSNLFPPKGLRMTWTSQFCRFKIFSNLFPPKRLRMTGNGQFCLIHNFSNAKKGPLSHQKMKCSFLDYVQLLMIGQVIPVMESQPKCKKRPSKSSKNEMLIFGLRSTFDDQPNDLSDES